VTNGGLPKSKGGCVGCHRFDDTATDPELSLFTDYGYDAIAVPTTRPRVTDLDAARYGGWSLRHTHPVR
jgi:cytochrome c peroxidase